MGTINRKCGELKLRLSACKRLKPHTLKLDWLKLLYRSCVCFLQVAWDNASFVHHPTLGRGWEQAFPAAYPGHLTPRLNVHVFWLELHALAQNLYSVPWIHLRPLAMCGRGPVTDLYWMTAHFPFVSLPVPQSSPPVAYLWLNIRL